MTDDRIKANINSLKNPRKGPTDIELLVNQLLASNIPFNKKRVFLKEIENIAFNKGIELPRYPIFSNDIEITHIVNNTGTHEFSTIPDKKTLPSEEDEISEKQLETINAQENREARENLEIANKVSQNSIKNVTSLFQGQAKSWIANYKRYYLFKIGNDLAKSEKAILIHDNIPSPELVQRALAGFNKSIPLDEFINKLKDHDSELWSTTHLCLLVLSDFSKMSYQLIDQSDLLSKFNTFKYYELIFERDDIRKYEYEGERLIQALQSDVHVSLTNANLNKAEESLVKSFFPPHPSLVQYELLKGGFSGSKVVEVSQVFSVPRPCKFIIKIGTKKDRKISVEETAVKRWVSSLIPSYQTEKKENSTHEALKYQFASIDGRRESMSFGNFFKDKHVDDIREVIGKIFNHDLFKAWEKLQVKNDKSISIENLYKEHLPIDKIFSEIEKIGFEEVNSDCNKFKDLLKKKLPNRIEKVCHGDLHSENIIVDGEKVFLIDFGMTSQAHCFIDYTTLEASIRFKLTPSYFPTKILNESDSHFANSFDTTDASLENKISSITLRKSYGVISKIRQFAIHTVRANIQSYSSNEELELNYLISLFCVSLRNIGYPDLNQKYALSFCRMLVNLLSLRL